MDVNLYARPAAQFITEIDHEWCAVASTQMVLAARPGRAERGVPAQLAGRIGEWESRRDSISGGWGPSAMVNALEAYGVMGYEVRTYGTRAEALADAARAISRLNAPVILLAWRGAHAWVMIGYRADADPLLFDDATIAGAYILDPWYPRVSTIWGPSDPPGTYQDAAEMRRNYLPWKRPEGATRSATACSSPSCPRSPWAAERQPVEASRPPGRSGRAAGRRASSRPPSPVRTAAPAANPSGIASNPAGSTSARVTATVTREPGERREDRQQRVVGGVEAARHQVAQGVERDRDREDHQHARREADVLRVERAAAQQHLDRERSHDGEADRGGHRQDADRERARPDLAPEPAAVAGRPRRGEARERRQRDRHADSATGTLWKLRAKLTAVTLPAASVVATLVKNRNVSGSMGWLSILGSISRTNSRSAGQAQVQPRAGCGTDERSIPTTRMPRWSEGADDGPDGRGPDAELSWSSSVPPAMPAL